MRNILFGLILCLPAGLLAQQAPEWDLLPNSPFNGYRSEDVFFVDANNGWAVIGSGGGQVYRTTDQGENWELVSSPSGYLRSTGFASTTKGWVGVLFSSAQLYETSNGGSTMADVTSRIQPGIPGGICGIWVVNDQVVYGVGQYNGPAYVIKTTNGGASWTSTDLSAFLGTLVDVYFFDEMHGLALGGFGELNGDIVPRIIGTDDGGATWTVRHTANSIERAWGWKLSFPTPNIGYASIEFFNDPMDGYLLKTINGGETWTEVPVPGGGSMQGGGFITPDLGWTSGRGVTSVTTDGGDSWQQIALDDGGINRFRFLGDSLGFAAGHQIYRLGPLPVANEESVDELASGFESISPNPSPGPINITYTLARLGDVRVSVYDLLGREVAVLLQRWETRGRHTVVWDPKSASGPRSTATYVVRLQTERGITSRLVTLLGG